MNHLQAFEDTIALSERFRPADTLAVLHRIAGARSSRPIGVYLASRYDHLSLMQQYKHRLEGAGFVVTSRWVTGAHDAFENEEDKRMSFALDDYHDIRAADWFVAFSEHPGTGSSRGGRHTELGLALAWNKRCVVIGPRENVFYYLPQIVRYSTWEEFYALEIVN